MEDVKGARPLLQDLISYYQHKNSIRQEAQAPARRQYKLGNFHRGHPDGNANILADSPYKKR